MCTICGCGRVIITVLLINLDFSQGLNQNFKRDVLSLNLICKTKCVSRCLYENTKIFAQCETECGHNTTMSCHKVICLPSLCQMDYTESDLLANSDSQEDNAYRTPVWGSLLLQSSLASFRVEWLLPPNMTSSIDGPLLYFTETLQEVTWVPSLEILLKPEAAFVRRCQSKTIRFVAVDSHGMVGASPYQTFNYSSSRNNSLQVTNITMSTLSMSNKIVRGLLSWKLPAGINNTDVAKYHLSIDYSIVKDYSCVSATAPSIQAFANEERADVENIQLMCRYVFHISYSTTCGEKSPDVIYTNKLECTSVEGGRCIRSNRSFGGRSNHRLGPNQTISAAEILVTEAYGKRSTEETIERGEEQEESELSPGALAGAIAGPLLALLCFSVTAVYCCRRYQRLLQERLSSKLLPSMSSGSNSSSSSYSITNTALHSSQSSSSTSTSQT
ncbi:hypothetical protein RvY_03260-3 [Ramazzottius varieornatus]|nr:hypothetical protein RvY_03260-3 [Ramazzottius varieornatus]